MGIIAVNMWSLDQYNTLNLCQDLISLIAGFMSLVYLKPHMIAKKNFCLSIRRSLTEDYLLWIYQIFLFKINIRKLCFI